MAQESSTSDDVPNIRDDDKPKDAAGKKWTSDFSMQVSCVTVAKGLYCRPRSAGCGKNARRRENYTNNVKSHMFNHNVCFSADAGKLARAQNWMHKLDSQQGINAEIRSLNTLLASLAKAAEFDCAEEWFVKCQTPAIHPELAGLRPNADSYNIMIQMFTKANALERAEKWYELIEEDLQTRPTLSTQLGLIKTCLGMGEVRRAHKLARLLIEKGCSQNKNYSPGLVKAERIQFRSQREWDVVGFFECLCALVEALAAVGNARTAHDWLRYFCSCGLKPEEAPAVWEKVRRVHPREIISCVLSGQQEDPLLPPSPPRTQLATLYGEGHHHYRGSKMSFASDASPPGSSIMRPDTSMSVRSATPRCARAALSDTGKRSAAATPSLRKFMDAKHRGASPSLGWTRSDRLNGNQTMDRGDQVDALLARADA
jgi:hypothetical protein|mmetsp:Transcript_47146/g.74503  ORF Transcript_47146/g.74503 Transcript_47146/m.74503 type:complete len:428 (+) Transcript_47146:57-1340(+)